VGGEEKEKEAEGGRKKEEEVGGITRSANE